MRGQDFGGSAVGSGSIAPAIVAAHELKSPLALLRQLALSLEDPSLTEPERQEIAHHMRLVSERALRLTTNLTKAHRLQDALFNLEPLNSGQLCEEVSRELSPLYAACGRTIRARVPRRQVLAVGNHDLLRRVLLNFADNALHYGESDAPVELKTELRDGGRTVRFGVRDFGPALSADIWRSLNQTMHQPVHARPESSGLGLSIARQFAEAMNGKVGAIRHRDGATFYVDMQASTQLSLL